MLQTSSSQIDAFYEGGGQAGQVLGLSHYIGILKRRWLRCGAAFSLVLLLGALITAIQRPVYESSGTVLVESQQIPSDLVAPTVTDTANERIKVIEQRIMTRDNLLGLMNKYEMFARERKWMSDSDLLDLMRQRTTFTLVDSQEKKPGPQQPSTIAFTVTFDYENPQITQRVTNEYLTLILAEDARNRINRAEETTRFLESESQRLQDQLAAIGTQITAVPAEEKATSQGALDPTRYSTIDLTKLKEDLAQKSAIYSDAHPYIITLKKKIVAMEALVAKSSSQTATARANGSNGTLVDLQRKQLDAEKALQGNNQKLEQARLGEKMERDQQAQRLQVIEQPALPQDPIRPNRVKFLAIAFALAMAAGLGVIVGSEAFDSSIRHSRELLAVAQGSMVVSIPYIATNAESRRRRGLLLIVLGVIGVCVLAGVILLLFFGPTIDLSWVNQYWLDNLTRLSK